MSLDIQIRQMTGGVAVLDLSGRVTLGQEAAVLRDTLHQMSAAGQKQILLNLAGVSYLDSSGLGVLVAAFASITNRGGQLKLLNMSSKLKNVLVVTKLYTVFEVFEDESAAISSFTASTEAAPAGG